jgi:hypothetical protein
MTLHMPLRLIGKPRVIYVVHTIQPDARALCKNILSFSEFGDDAIHSGRFYFMDA